MLLLVREMEMFTSPLPLGMAEGVDDIDGVIGIVRIKLQSAPTASFQIPLLASLGQLDQLAFNLTFCRH